MIKVKHKGNFNKAESFFNWATNREYLNVIRDYAEEGLRALKQATPNKSTKTVNAWNYTIEDRDGVTTLTYTNDHVENGCNVVILLVYGHGTNNGGYVEGNDFVSPALEPIFLNLRDKMWKEAAIRWI